MNLNREELAWAAGLFDGEGCLSLCRNRTSLQRNLTVAQNDPRVLLRFREAVGGIGDVYARKNGRTWDYRTCRGEHVQQVIAALWYWLSPVKKEQARRVLMDYRAWRDVHPPGRRLHPGRR